jgi:putative ubiquitin-RnfH superfamily antitoxin RatB of RatAB toxin-antitoxin module
MLLLGALTRYMVGAKHFGRIVVEIAYACADRQTIVELELEKGATAEQAIEESGILERYSEIDLKVNKTGIFGKLVDTHWQLRDRDRVEIYRPLPTKPAGLRSQRAAAERKRKPLRRC